MPIKKHVCTIGDNLTLTIPKSIADSLGLGAGCPVRVFSNNDGYSFKVESIPTAEVVVMGEHYKLRVQELQTALDEKVKENQKLRDELNRRNSK